MQGYFVPLVGLHVWLVLEKNKDANMKKMSKDKNTFQSEKLTSSFCLDGLKNTLTAKGI